MASTRLDVAACEALATELAANPTLSFLRLASNDLDGPSGRTLANAVETSHCETLMVDASRNPAMNYQDVARLRLTNNARADAAGDNPLDGAKKADQYLS